MAAPRSPNRQLQKLLDSAAGGIYLLDGDGRIVFANSAIAAWVGVEPDSLIGLVCRYHSVANESGDVPLAARLSPPPPVYFGEREIVEISLPQVDGATESRRVEFIPIPGGDDETVAVIALVFDKSPAPVTPATLEPTPAHWHVAVERHRRTIERRYSIDRLLGESIAARRMRAQIQFAATGNGHVLLVGPSGSGRQHLARVIHNAAHSSRPAAWVPLSSPLLSAELLSNSIRALNSGGSNTIAGTLFLQEVDQLPAEAQLELKATLDGPVSFRILATSRRPLIEMASRGEFPSDVAALLSSLVIEVPPLVERLDDLPLLAQALLEQVNAEGGKQLYGFTPEALDALATYPWPGNFDELAEFIRAAHEHTAGPVITPADLPERLELASHSAARPRKNDDRIVLPEFLAGIEKELIERALRRVKGNKAKAARLLGMTRPRLYRRMVQLGLEKQE